MSDTLDTHPDLEERFMQPPGWRWHNFKRNGRTIRFGTASPANSIPDAVVVCLPGLSEFAEKYYEVARTLLDQNMAFWILDWPGQGLSSRYLKNAHKRHSEGFDYYIEDLHAFILDYIKHSSVHPDKGRIPLAMLAHSMGGNIGLRYLHEHPDMFECAAFSAPMIGIHTVSKLPKIVQILLSGFLNLVAGRSYVWSGSNWKEDERPEPGNDAFSSDPLRGAINNAWCLHNPDLQAGSVTYGWVYYALRSCLKVQKPEFLSSIQTHCLLAIAGHEDFVDNDSIRKAHDLLPNSELLELQDSRHEIFMERNEIRDQFFGAFKKLIEDTIIKRPETLKPF